ncbi:hypothetical protein HHL23_18315 [Chryseobacterium sp. RP-3-3]|uniref:Uncharacterized protein n=1 Tax=Chryseobacterium antibioticum TaxID=2728847 RepID=A0A7Y0AQQ7_9FLAO|nr:hypothetical protein [Chryseobacterium antibioticum]NML71736.1 hypothetical protein [Chryseobacterium antibioticum]
MNPESLEENIQIIAVKLIKLAEDQCWNKISHHLTFIVSDFNEFGGNFHERRKLRNKVNRCKTPLPLDKAIKMLKNEYHDLYDINLYIYKALQNETVIEIQYFRKLNMESAYYEKIRHDPPMLHAKITHPRYALGGDKFDINWESDGWLRSYWYSFLYEFKCRRMMKKFKK